jgi:hypothetical protein
MKAFIDEHRGVYGVEPICRVLPIAPSTYYAHAARQADPQRCSARGQRDRALVHEIERVWNENFRVYGVRKVWRQLRREGFDMARCTVERLMKRLGLRGIIRGKGVHTTVSDANAPCPLDHVQRNFKAGRPNQLWVSDFTYVSTWQGIVTANLQNPATPGRAWLAFAVFAVLLVVGTVVLAIIYRKRAPLFLVAGHGSVGLIALYLLYPLAFPG